MLALPNPNAPDLAPGTLADRYLVEERRHHGGYGAVYRARQLGSGSAVALKVLHYHLAHIRTVLLRFQREAEVLNQLRHPGIVSYLGSGELHDGRPYIAMEWLEGHDLEVELRRRGPLSAADALAVIGQIATPLMAAHAVGVVHRDLKPQNVVVLPQDVWFEVKLVDFSIAKLLEPMPGLHGESLTQSTILGTPLYMSPEQILGQEVDARTDIYALGILLFRMLTGQLPFQGANALEVEQMHLVAPPPSASDLAPVPSAVDAVVHRCLRKAPKERFQSVAELRDALHASRRAAPKEPECELLSLGLYVEALVDPGPDEPDDEPDDAILDDVESVLQVAKEALGRADLVCIKEMPNAVLGARVLPKHPVEREEVHKRTLVAARELEALLAAREASPFVTVVLTLRQVPAIVRTVRGKLQFVGGDLLRLGAWAHSPGQARPIAGTGCYQEHASEILASLTVAPVRAKVGA